MQIDIVLVKTRHAGNIGATARIMKNMGFSGGLTLVHPTPRGHLEAVKMAPGAEEIIETARITETLEEAIENCELTLAVTRRPRRMRKEVFAPQAAAELVNSYPGRVGLVFGSEKWGLSNEEIRLCSSIVTIPSAPEHPSLNLAQAVAVVLYLVAGPQLDMPKQSKKSGRKPDATSREKRELFDTLTRALKDSGFFVKTGNRKTVADIEDIFNRANLDQRDVSLLLGVFKSLGGE